MNTFTDRWISRFKSASFPLVIGTAFFGLFGISFSVGSVLPFLIISIPLLYFVGVAIIKSVYIKMKDGREFDGEAFVENWQTPFNKLDDALSFK